MKLLPLVIALAAGLPAIAETNPQSDLSVVKDGNPVTMVTARSYTRDGQPWVLISSKPLDCDVVTARSRPIDDQEVFFLLSAMPDGKGSLVWMTHYEASSAPADDGVQIDTLDVEPEGRTRGRLKLSLEPCCGETGLLEVEGTFDAIGCPSPTS